jgi:hypothetical protein
MPANAHTNRGPLPPALQPKQPNVPRIALKLSELAESLGVSECHLAKQPLPYVPLGQRKVYVIAAIEAWLAAHLINPAEDELAERPALDGE